MYNKTIIRFGLCDIQNNQGLGKGYRAFGFVGADGGSGVELGSLSELYPGHRGMWPGAINNAVVIKQHG